MEGQEAPHQAWARPRGSPRLHMVWVHGGAPWVAPGAIQPHFMNKIFAKVFRNYSRNFVFGKFQNLKNNSNTGKQLWNNENQVYRNSKTF